MKKKLLIGIIAALAAVIAAAVISGNIHDRKLMQEGDVIVQKVEHYRQTNGRLPENLREMGLPESEGGPLYYDKSKDGQNYTVSFGTALGESTTYHSETKEWRNY